MYARENEEDEGHKRIDTNILAQKMKERMISTVPEADVVVTNPTHFAVALKYDDNRPLA